MLLAVSQLEGLHPGIWTGLKPPPPPTLGTSETVNSMRDGLGLA